MAEFIRPRRGHRPRLGTQIHEDRRTKRVRSRSERNRQAINEQKEDGQVRTLELLKSIATTAVALQEYADGLDQYLMERDILARYDEGLASILAWISEGEE